MNDKNEIIEQLDCKLINVLDCDDELIILLFDRRKICRKILIGFYGRNET